MNNEGVVKFRVRCEWAPPLPEGVLREIIHWRQVMHSAGLIGSLTDGTGYGNISQRGPTQGSFIISGAATGHLPSVTEAHFALVTRVYLERNLVQCRGPVVASSESLSHAAIYRADTRVNAVVHVHSPDLWKALVNLVPTTHPEAAYGTVEMAKSILSLMNCQTLRSERIIVMAGHRDGLLAFGNSLAEACGVLLSRL